MIPDYAYTWIYTIFLTILCFVHRSTILHYPTLESFNNRKNSGYTNSIFLICAIALFVCTIPMTDKENNDLYRYAMGYLYSYDLYDLRKDPFWKIIAVFCRDVCKLSVGQWLFIIHFITFALRLFVCHQLFRKSVYTALLFVLADFSFWNGATNIIRSALAMSFVVYGIVLFLNNAIKYKLIALALFVCARYTHSSSILLTGCFLASYFFIKKISWSIAFYLLCIVLSLTLGHYFELFFASLGFDDRMESYTTDVDYSSFSHAGFRWDFLMYSIVPIVLGWYIIYKQKVNNMIYSYLLNTYILSNAFWVLVIRAGNSDRFAGVSWTLYPIVIAYPLCYIVLLKKQTHAVWYGLLGLLSFLWFLKIYGLTK